MRKPAGELQDKPPGLSASHAVLSILAVIFLLVIPGRTQNGTPRGSVQQPIGQPAGNPFDTGGAADDRQSMQERQFRMLNAERQKSLVSDTNKLLKLAMELNLDIEQKATASLTLDQLHKLAEIEKLAHNVKDKMSTSVRGIPAFQPQAPSIH